MAPSRFPPAKPRMSRLTVGLLAVALAWPAWFAGPRSGEAVAQESSKELLRAVVGVRAKIARDDPTAGDLGTEREGSGVVIDESGLVLTIGYLMRRAESAEILDADGRTVPAVVVGSDDETGFGLLRPLQPLNVAPARFGDAAALKEGTPVLAVSFGRPPEITAARVFARRPFAGPWEYLIDDAIYTSPPHQDFGGAALLGEDGALLGIGSLFLNVAEPMAMIPGNMFVPIDLLKPILAGLAATGEAAGPSRPWLGIRPKDSLGKLVVASVVENGPGARAGIKAGDLIVGIGGRRVTTMVEFFRKAWALGGAGTVVPLDVFRADGQAMKIDRVDVVSGDRKDRFRRQGKQGL